MHGQFARDMENKDTNNTWTWMRESDLERCTEALIGSSQEQTIRLTISSTILTKLPSHPFEGCVVQEMRLYLI